MGNQIGPQARAVASQELQVAIPRYVLRRTINGRVPIDAVPDQEERLISCCDDHLVFQTGFVLALGGKWDEIDRLGKYEWLIGSVSQHSDVVTPRPESASKRQQRQYIAAATRRDYEEMCCHRQMIARIRSYFQLRMLPYLSFSPKAVAF
jgi:hypothetical protein